MTSSGLRERSLPLTKGTIQYVQKLLQPYIIGTLAFTLLSLITGSPSAITPSLSGIDSVLRFSLSFSYIICGNVCITCVPKMISTCGNDFLIRCAICSCCTIQPPTAIIRFLFFSFSFLSAPILPKTLSSAFSLTAQVLKRIRSANAVSGVKP